MSVAAELFLQIEQDFYELKKSYTLFFSDQVKVEPFELREQMMRRIKRLRNLSNLRTEEQFRTNNLIAKVQSHIQLWDRQLERKYQGRDIKRPRHVAAPAAKVVEKKEAPRNKSVLINDAGKQREQVVELYDEYTRLNLILGARKMINFSKFQAFIQKQTDKVKQVKGDANVRYEVLVQDQKVVIKSKSVKKG